MRISSSMIRVVSILMLVVCALVVWNCVSTRLTQVADKHNLQMERVQD